jgi:hypothetical protein
MKKKETHQIKLKTQAKQSSTTNYQTNQQLTIQSHTRTDGLHNKKPNKEEITSQTFIAKFYYFNNLFFLGSYDIFEANITSQKQIVFLKNP